MKERTAKQKAAQMAKKANKVQATAQRKVDSAGVHENSLRTPERSTVEITFVLPQQETIERPLKRIRR